MAKAMISIRNKEDFNFSSMYHLISGYNVFSS